MYDLGFTYEEFRIAMLQVSEKINELSDTLNDFAAKVVEAWQNIFSQSMYTYEALAELAKDIDLRYHRKKPPRPSYKKEYGHYGYVKSFQRNLPYQRRRY